MCDCYEELADLEEIESFKRTAAKKRILIQQETVEAAPITN